MTGTGPAAPAGVVAVKVVGDVTVTLVAAFPSNCTVLPGAKSVPVSVTGRPPAVAPVAGAIDVSVGDEKVSRARAVPQSVVSNGSLITSPSTTTSVGWAGSMAAPA